uniref:NADH-ubiquinone oxidoreductase chain 3 n=2 Tax=Chorthippus parallelus TaxID=37639 RepID=A0A8F0WF74_CHOPA|nr:NADH dehydrogenase subunit 3 [Chorthippus parallelus parallelus]YP_010133595.1 NADH dehydrogenase subunit 3 [Chorthippus parallelus erythropus]QWM92863.1 NADH dehydrogenase subunit 3 [Chorthippus parallelus parallelus]QWM92885.1 NADH dehydrogenase subunit 3 [Chorthippus parallelus erythropus]QWM92898.1 NADH dehydrogenase subunit 3 [Chorthippus parallelus erythropus]QWM92911.1 NADH dehydrogenase subunit 3 [Chorthippus parallelus erythropus]
MLTLSTSILISFIVPMTIMLITTMLSKKLTNDREKSSPFECGFDPKSSARMPFSLRFFLIAVIFLIFDVEIALILPIVIIMKTSNIVMWTLSTMFFIMVLLGGLYYEWNWGALQWAD